VVVVWLVFGIVLFLVELRHLAFYALFGAVGCLGAAVVAAFAPTAVPLQAAVAVVLAVVGVVTVRPYVSRTFEQRHDGHVARGVHGGLVGQQALTLDAVGDTPAVGHVRLIGERWLAVSGSGVIIPANTTVLVTAVQGTTLVVWPVSDLGGHLPDLEPPDGAGAPDGADGRPT